MIILNEELDYYLEDEEISELDRKCRSDDIVKLDDKVISEIKKGLQDFEELQKRMRLLREKGE